MSTRSICNVIVVVLLTAALLLPASALTNGLRYLALGYILIDLLLRARAGYLRRRPHWTRESWRRYLAVCAIPIGALLIFAGMMLAFEFRLSVVGEARSTTRAIWTSGMLVFMLIGGVGLAIVVEWLAQGEPSRPFTWPRWREQSSSGPHSTA